MLFSFNNLVFILYNFCQNAFPLESLSSTQIKMATKTNFSCKINYNVHPPLLRQIIKQHKSPKSQKEQTQQTQQTTATTKQDDKKKKVKDLPPSPDYLLAGIGDYMFCRPLGHGKFSKVMLAKYSSHR